VSDTVTLSYANHIRWHQAFDMRDDLLAGGLEVPEWQVLQALSRRLANISDPPKSGEIQRIKDTCFPAVPTIAEDAGLKTRRTQIALDRLETAGFITREPIPGRQLKRTRIITTRFDKYAPRETFTPTPTPSITSRQANPNPYKRKLT
jgi:DNA-binding MarR family transcriptional regulator